MSSYRDVRALVLGASGFIGRRVARDLVRAGADLYVAARDPDRLPDDIREHGQVIDIDLLDSDALQEAIRAVVPDIVFNLAGYGINPAERDPALAAAINTDCLSPLVDAVAALPATAWRGQRVVHTGSALEYGISAGDLAENTVPEPTTLYGQTKLAGTRALADAAGRAGIAAVTARLFTVYGPGERAGRLLPALFEAARSGELLELTAGTQQRDFTYVGDVAEGLLRLGTAGGAPGDVVNLATGRLLPVRAFTETAAQVLGIPPGHLRFGALPGRPEEMAHKPVATAKIQKLLGWLPTTTVRQGIEYTLAAERADGVETPGKA